MTHRLEPSHPERSGEESAVQLPRSPSDSSRSHNPCLLSESKGFAVSMSPRHPYNPCHSERSEGSAFLTCGSRIWLLAICVSILLAREATACTVVVVQSDLSAIRPSVRLRLLHDGKPLSATGIELFLGRPNQTTNDLPYLTLATNTDGSINIRELSVATYYVRIKFQDHREAVFTLDVPLKTESRASNNGIDLVATSQEPSDLGFVATPAAQSPRMAEPLRVSLQQFRGVLADVTGAAISNVDVKVYAAGKSVSEPVVPVRTSPSGQFAADVEKGNYVAVFSAPGFNIQPVEFSIADHGWREIWVTLMIANGCGLGVPSQGKITEY